MQIIRDLRPQWQLIISILLLSLVLGLTASSEVASASAKGSTVQPVRTEARRSAAFDASCPLVGSIVPSANDAGTTNTLNDVEAVADNDVWAVGASNNNTLIEHWDGNMWSVVPSINVGPLNSISAVSANDIWAVGGVDSTSRILHWNGAAWSTSTQHSYAQAKVYLYAVEAISANDVWAVGTVYYPDNNDPPAGSHLRLILHWNGVSWNAQDIFSAGVLYGISAIAANDIWAVGYKELCEPGWCHSNGTLTMHWDGQNWTDVPSPNFGTAIAFNSLSAVSARAENDVWAVGNAACTPIVLHWDGSTWNSVPVSENCQTLTDVSATAANNVWLVGYRANQTYTAQWNGTSWTDVATPHPGEDSDLWGIATTPGGNTWAVGSTSSNEVAHTLAMRGISGQWSVTPSPDKQMQNNVLRDVAAVAPDDAWAAGYTNENTYTGNSEQTQVLIEHWNGTNWTQAEVPYREPGQYLYGIEAVSANDVWAVGTQPGVIPYSLPGERYLTMHWNGAAWTTISTTFSSSQVDRLYGVAAVSTNDVWAVGVYSSNNSVMHWNGSEWQRITLPSNIPAGTLTSVAAIAANDAWAVGRTGSSTLTIHWNGTEWSLVPSPNVGTGRSFLFGVDAVAADDVWAVGYYGPQGSGYPLTLHWDGSQWNVVSAPGLGTGTYLLGVDAVSADNVWAVGNYFVDGVPRTLMMNWNGAEWSVIASPNANTGSNHLYGVSAASANDIWTVGDFTVDGIQQTLVERYGPVAFSDVPATNTFFPYVQCLTCRGILGGYSDGTFRPNANVTRGQLSKIVANSAGFNEPVSGQTYEDVPTTNSFYQYVERMSARAIIGGYPCGIMPSEPCGSGNKPYFRPNADATRGQISKIVSEAKGYTDPAGTQIFEDVPISNTFFTWIQRLASRGIMGGYPCGSTGEPCGNGNRPYFRPINNATRGQTSKIVSNAFFPNCQTENKP